MIESRKPPNDLYSVDIPLGSGSRAHSRWCRLDDLLRIGKQQLRAMGNADDARVLYLWQKTNNYKIVEYQHWTLTMYGEEWQALSRALRHSGTEGRTMCAWLNAQRINTYVQLPSGS